jgi:hypothetical protein
MLITLVGSRYSQLYPTVSGQFDCNDKYLFEISPAHWGTTLNGSRLSPRFLGPSVIYPQS